jgi:hypothetical protein
MTLSDLIATARLLATSDVQPYIRAFAQGVVDRLGMAQECGWPEPYVVQETHGAAVRHEDLGTLTPDNADNVALMLMRAADEARGRR